MSIAEKSEIYLSALADAAIAFDERVVASLVARIRHWEGASVPVAPAVNADSQQQSDAQPEGKQVDAVALGQTLQPEAVNITVDPPAAAAP